MENFFKLLQLHKTIFYIIYITDTFQLQISEN